MGYKTKFNELKKEWKREDLKIRGEIARYITMRNINMAELGQLLGISRTTMYEKFNNPERFTLGEYRILVSLFREFD